MSVTHLSSITTTHMSSSSTDVSTTSMLSPSPLAQQAAATYPTSAGPRRDSADIKVPDAGDQAIAPLTDVARDALSRGPKAIVAFLKNIMLNHKEAQDRLNIATQEFRASKTGDDPNKQKASDPKQAALLIAIRDAKPFSDAIDIIRKDKEGKRIYQNLELAQQMVACSKQTDYKKLFTKGQEPPFSFKELGRLHTQIFRRNSGYTHTDWLIAFDFNKKLKDFLEAGFTDPYLVSKANGDFHLARCLVAIPEDIPNRQDWINFLTDPESPFQKDYNSSGVQAFMHTIVPYLCEKYEGNVQGAHDEFISNSSEISGKLNETANNAVLNIS